MIKTWLRFTIVLALCSSANHIAAQAKKTALIVAIAEYKPGTNWQSLSSMRDDTIVTKALIQRGFTKFIKIQNEKATIEGIRNGFAELEKSVSKGDIVYIHFSCHGQQLWDDDGDMNGDELDGYDECIVPYDAPSQYSPGYRGERHLRDDELNLLVKKIRKKLGPQGDVLVINDACFSGTSLRGGNEKFRGDVKPMKPSDFDPSMIKKNKTVSANELIDSFEKMAPVVLISGAKADKPNMEFQRMYGSLSYAMTHALDSLKENESYLRLFGLIQNQLERMHTIQSNFQQEPAIEGQVNRTVFKGNRVFQAPYFRVKFIKSAEIEIEANRLSGIFPGTVVAFMPAGSPCYSPDNVLWYDTVSVVDYKKLILTKLPPEKKWKADDLWMFVVQQKFEKKTKLTIQFHPSISDKSRSSIIKCLALCDWVDYKNANAELVIISKDNEFQLVDSGGTPLYTATPDFEKLKQQIIYYQHIRNFLSYDFANSKYSAGIDIKKYTRYIDPSGTMMFEEKVITIENGEYLFAKDELVRIPVLNNSGMSPYYLHIILINPSGYCNLVAPNYLMHENAIDFKIDPNRTEYTMIKLGEETGGLGHYICKVFVSSYPLTLPQLHFPPYNWENPLAISENKDATVLNQVARPVDTSTYPYNLRSYTFRILVK